MKRNQKFMISAGVVLFCGAAWMLSRLTAPNNAGDAMGRSPASSSAPAITPTIDATGRPIGEGTTNFPSTPPNTYPSTESTTEGPPVATAVAGSPGLVFSPFSQKIVDVRDIPSGTLVQDPGFPATEKKLFRVP